MKAEVVDDETESDEEIDVDGDVQPGAKRPARPDVQERHKRKNTIQESAVKMTLNQLCSVDPGLRRGCYPHFCRGKQIS